MFARFSIETQPIDAALARRAAAVRGAHRAQAPRRVRPGDGGPCGAPRGHDDVTLATFDERVDEGPGGVVDVADAPRVSPRRSIRRPMIEVRRRSVPSGRSGCPVRGGMDGVAPRRGGVRERLVHVEGEPVVVRAAQPSADRVVIGARGGAADVAEEAIARMRFALGVDDDLRAFYDRFRDDPLIGPSVRTRPQLRIRPPPGAVRGARVGDQRAAHRVRARRPRSSGAIVCRLGRRAPRGTAPALRDLPAAADARRHGARAAAGAATCRPAARSRCAAPRARSPSGRARPARRRPRAAAGGGCARSRASAAGRSRCSALHGQGRHDLAPRRRPRPPQARRRALQTGNPHGARDRGRGPRVLRALRGLGRAWPALHALARGRAAAPGGPRGAAHASPCARQELVRSGRAPASAASASSLLCAIQSP